MYDLSLLRGSNAADLPGLMNLKWTSAFFFKHLQDLMLSIRCCVFRCCFCAPPHGFSDGLSGDVLCHHSVLVALPHCERGSVAKSVSRPGIQRGPCEIHGLGWFRYLKRRTHAMAICILYSYLHTGYVKCSHPPFSIDL